MNFQRTGRRKLSPDITSLIDVIFIILVFFMLFANFNSSPMGLDVELPKAVSGSPQQNSQFEVTVTKDGVFYVDGKAVTGTELRTRLTTAIKGNPDVFVIVKADKQVRYEHVVNALDHVRAVGGHKLGLAVDQGPQ